MANRFMIIFALLTILFAAGLSQCQAEDNSMNENASDVHNPYYRSSNFANESTTALVNTSTEPSVQIDGTKNATDPIHNLSYIWSIAGIEPDQVIIALDQEGEDLYGQAKYEPDNGLSWNGDVVGSIKEDRVDLVIAALNSSTEVTLRLTGTFNISTQSINGDFFMIHKGLISDRGKFEAIWVNPDISSYTPATIKGPKVIAAAPIMDEDASSMKADSEYSIETPVQKSRYHDVREDADRILTGVGDISQIPIGMGGSGLS